MDGMPARPAAIASHVVSPITTRLSAAGSRPVHVCPRHPRLDQVAGSQHVDVALHLLRLRARRQHDSVSERPESLEQVAGGREGRDLVDQLGVSPRLAVADRVAEAAFDVVAGDRRDELVAAHPVVPVDAPERDADPVVGEGPAPCDRMLVVRVDERAVDVDDCAMRGGSGVAIHAAPLPGGRGGQTCRALAKPIRGTTVALLLRLVV
jgi:hypothetical protein